MIVGVLGSSLLTTMASIAGGIGATAACGGMPVCGMVGSMAAGKIASQIDAGRGPDTYAPPTQYTKSECQKLKDAYCHDAPYSRECRTFPMTQCLARTSHSFEKMIATWHTAETQSSVSSLPSSTPWYARPATLAVGGLAVALGIGWLVLT